jgi:hypothetical protein
MGAEARISADIREFICTEGPDVAHTVIASRSEAIHSAAGGRMDCFGRSAPRNDAGAILLNDQFQGRPSVAPGNDVVPASFFPGGPAGLEFGCRRNSLHLW